MLAPETVLQGRYRILRQLGQGGMGAVYEAIDQRLDTTVALKETLFAEEKLRRQFEREARLLARLHHPALPRVSDHFAEGDGAFLVMQFIGGDDLAEMISRRRGPFPLEQVLLWADQLLDALDYLHTQDPQIIHRDIKPQNLKLSARGQIILLDFGLAKGQLGEISRGPTTASIFGYTPNYAPLEQIQGLGTDPRSDIYALGATLYHLATGIKPPDALSRAAAIVNGQPDSLTPGHEINPAVGPQVAAVLQRAMAQNRDQRYGTAAAMRQALKTSNEATVGGRDEAATVLFPSPSTAPTQLGAASPTVPIAITQPGGETTVVKTPVAIRKSNALPWGIAAGLLVLLLGGAVAGFFYVSQKRRAENAGPTITLQPITGVLVSQPSPSAQPTGVQVSGVTDQKVERSDPSSDAHKKDESTKSESAKNQSKKDAARRKHEAETDPDDAEAEAERREAQAEQERAEKEKNKHPEPPNVPEPGYIEVPGPHGGTRRIPTVKNKTLPDGTKVMITPNGTRIVTLPDGSMKVIPPPGQRRRPRS